MTKDFNVSNLLRTRKESKFRIVMLAYVRKGTWNLKKENSHVFEVFF